MAYRALLLICVLSASLLGGISVNAEQAGPANIVHLPIIVDHKSNTAPSIVYDFSSDSDSQTVWSALSKAFEKHSTRITRQNNTITISDTKTETSRRVAQIRCVGEGCGQSSNSAAAANKQAEPAINTRALDLLEIVIVLDQSRKLVFRPLSSNEVELHVMVAGETDPLQQIAFVCSEPVCTIEVFVDQLYVTPTPTPAVSPTPDPWLQVFAVPGRFEAEDYLAGGQGVGYFDSSSGNSGGKYRNDDVDIETTQDEGGGYNVGWTASGEWLEYKIHVSASGDYRVNLRMAAPYADKRFHLEIDGLDVSGPVTIPRTGQWQTWVDVPVDLQLDAGSHVMRFVAETDGFNVNYFDISALNVPVDPVVFVNTETVATGDVVSIAVDIENLPSGQDLGAVEVDIQYDPVVLGVVACEADPLGSFDTSLCNTDASGRVQIRMLSADGLAASSERLANITFLATGSPGTNSALTFSHSLFVDTAGNSLKVQKQEGSVTIAQAPTTTPQPTMTATPVVTPNQPVGERGRVRVVNGNVVADNGMPLRGEQAEVLNRGYTWNDLRTKFHLNAIRIYVRANSNNISEIPGVIPTIDRFVNEAAEQGFYVIIDNHFYCCGQYDRAFNEAFWNTIAPRYKDRTHVLYEIQNEPVAWHPISYHDAEIKFQEDMYELIRSHAPDTHIIAWTFANMAEAALPVVAAGTRIDYSNASVGYHVYNSITDAEAGIELLRDNGYPVINTEIGGELTEQGPPYPAYTQRTESSEKLGVSWIWLNGYNKQLNITWPADPWAVPPSDVSTPVPTTTPAPTNTPTPTATPHPVGDQPSLHWGFDHRTDTVAQDDSSAGNHGTIYGASRTDSGKIGRAILLDGANDNVTIADSDLNGPFPAKSSAQAQDFTVSAWVKLDATSVRNPIVAKQGNEIRGLYLAVESDGCLNLEVWKNQSKSSMLKSSAALVPNQWYHVAAAYDYTTSGSSVARLFINGVEVGQSSSFVGPVQPNSEAFQVGRYYWNSQWNWHFDGAVDDVRVYNRVLNQAEIQSIMTP